MLQTISLGAGVQSSVMALMAAEGAISPMPDAAIFADTQWEPPAVYEHLDWLETQLPFPIHRVTGGDIRQNLWDGLDPSGAVFTDIPAFLKMEDGAQGMGKRQCTTHYKVIPIERELRRILGRKRVPPGIHVMQWLGISLDEVRRMRTNKTPWIENRYPLVDLGMTREDCKRWFDERYPERSLPRSACIGCPYHSDREWAIMRQTDAESWADAVEMDARLRDPDRPSRNRGALYLHRSRKPLSDNAVLLGTLQPAMFDDECEGLCGV